MATSCPLCPAYIVVGPGFDHYKHVALKTNTATGQVLPLNSQASNVHWAGVHIYIMCTIKLDKQNADYKNKRINSTYWHPRQTSVTAQQFFCSCNLFFWTRQVFDNIMLYSTAVVSFSYSSSSRRARWRSLVSTNRGAAWSIPKWRRCWTRADRWWSPSRQATAGWPRDVGLT